MKFEKTFFVILSGVLITAFLLITFLFPTGSGLETNNSPAKKIYYVDNISKAHQKVIDAFNKKYEGQIRVEAINLSFDKFSTNERKELLARYLRNKSDRIDVFAVDQIWVPRFAKWAVPLTQYYSTKERQRLLQYALETCVYNDSLMAFPLYIDIAHLYYRDDVLRKLPNYFELKKKIDSSITWTDLTDLSKKISANKSPIYIFQADNYEGLICSFFEMLANSHRSFYRNDTLYLNETGFKKVLNQLVKMIYTDKISPEKVLELKENESSDFFLKEEGFSIRAWSSLKERGTTPEYAGILKNLQRAPTPHFAEEKPTSIFGGWNLMISKYSTNVNEAIKFINFFTSEESQKLMYREGGYLPVLNYLYEDKKFFEDSPDLFFFKNLMKQGIHRPFFQKYTIVSDILANAIHSALKKEVNVDTAVKIAYEKIRMAGIIVQKAD
ncbi:MAG: extracellular solute-binding protein [Ignavibacteriaceae bacterium]|jgi:multiple sugar transport system substrate-binding protein|nr:extracellular solute-binding protein [Ignavibacteriaceae bacterium]